jgi:hypothetical protein
VVGFIVYRPKYLASYVRRFSSLIGGVGGNDALILSENPAMPRSRCRICARPSPAPVRASYLRFLLEWYDNCALSSA